MSKPSPAADVAHLPTNNTINVEIRNANDLSYEQFCTDFLLPRKPVLIRGALSEMPASDWTIESLKKAYGHKSFLFNDEQVQLATLIEAMANSQNDKSDLYLTNVNISNEFPEIAGALTGAPTYARFNWRNTRLIGKLLDYNSSTSQFFIGAQGSGFPFMHVDYPPMHTFSALFAGTKEWLLVDPAHSDGVYPKAGEQGWTLVSDLNDPFAPNLEQYPHFDATPKHRFKQQAGDLAFVPSGWWHCARNLDLSVTVAWDHLNTSSWQASIDWRFRNLQNKSALAQSAVAALTTGIDWTGSALEAVQRKLKLQGHPNIV